MTSLQVENGQYTRIVNQVLEQLVKAGLLGSEYQVVLLVIRKTWGYNKTQDFISLTQFEQGTGLSRHTVIKTIRNLVSKKILVQGSTPGKQGKAYKYNKYWNSWVVNPAELVQNSMSTSAKERLKLVKRSTHTKDNTKENKRDELIHSQSYLQLRERWSRK